MSNKIELIEKQIKIVFERLQVLRNMGINDPFDLEMDFMNNMSEFYEEYPSIIKRVCREENQDNTYLYKMIHLLKKVEEGNTSLGAVELSLGNELAEKFVYPIVNNLGGDKPITK
jgi:hypothetical protein